MGTGRVPATGSAGTRWRSWIGRCPRPVAGGFTTPIWRSMASSRCKRFRIASANPLLPTAKSQKSIHNLAVQSLDIDVFLLQPPAEIGDYDDLLSDRVVRIALFGYSGRIGVEVFTQRPLAEPFNRA